MKLKEIRKLSNEDLNTKLKLYKEEYFNLRHQLSTSKGVNPKRIRTVKKTIARILTILKEIEKK